MIRYTFILATLFFASHVFGLNMTPFIHEFKPSGPAASQLFKINNDAQSPIAVRIKILSRNVSTSGIETNKPAQSKFQIYPSQFILKANATKGVRLRWLGQKKLQKEAAFRIVVEQMPIDLTPEQSTTSMKIIHKLVGAIYVTPKHANAELEISEINKIQDNNGNNLLQFNIHNSGNKHSHLRNHVVELQGSTNIKLDKSDLSSIKSLYIPANQSRLFELPWPDTLGNKIPTMSIQ